MKLSVMAATATLLAVSQPAFADTTISGEVTSVELNDADPGLVVFATPIAFAPISLGQIGDFADRVVMRIGTSETTVNTDFLSLFGEDTVPYPISASFTFSAPNGVSGVPIAGSTFGFIRPLTSCGVIAGGCGRVNWGSPSEFAFGNGGRFSVELFDASFATPGSTDVTGRFTLLAAASAVPEPATWVMMILAFGMVGTAIRRRRAGARGFAHA